MPGAPRRGGGGERRERREDRRGSAAEKQAAYLEHVVTINRVAKVVKGGRRFSFTALVVVGDGNGMVGVGYGKAKEVPAAIAKGVEEAKKHFFRVPRIGSTIPHTVQGEAAAGVVLLKPASPGTGVIAGGPVRAVLECAGISDVLSRSLGSSNPINVVHATVAALKSLNRPEEIAAKRGLPIEDVAPAAMLRAARRGGRSRSVRRGQDGEQTMAQLKVTQIKSKIGGTSAQRNSLRSLGLHRIGQVVVRPDRPEFRGMIKTVRHLVTVEEVGLDAGHDTTPTTRRRPGAGSSCITCGRRRARTRPRCGSAAARRPRGRPRAAAPRAPRRATRFASASRAARCRCSAGCRS